ncbi:queuine tRNA-ribosyltransferase family protein [Candidatus Pacearchaeota archaeon]|nr:queuine tRNA-ribosyltransferase family protein [Candidatus Pacearchaeota archaeon]
MKTRQQIKSIKTSHGYVHFPAFFPDATCGFVKSVSSADLKNAGVDGVVVNIYHLLKNNLVDKIARKGGIHRYMNFNKPVISDSGGFQVMSLIHRHPELGKIEDEKITFMLDGKKVVLTPETCIQLQLKIKSDIVMCLDDCTEASISQQEQKKSVERTISWAKRCKQEFERLTKNKRHAKGMKKPLIFAIVQGGENRTLRKHCAKELLKIGFDGYSFGGWPVKKGRLLSRTLKYVSSLIPEGKPRYAMGIGKPQDIIDAVKFGYDMFDCVIPTRDARHKRLFVCKGKNKNKIISINIRKKYFNMKADCDCHFCRNYSFKDLHAYFRNDRRKAERLATIHNLRLYSRMMERLREKRKRGKRG